MKIIEGGGSVDIHISVTLPPRFWCNSTLLNEDKGCLIQIRGLVEINDEDFTCYQGENVPQAVIGYFSEDDRSGSVDCGLIITDDNWYMPLWLPVIATVDGVVDGTQIRQLSIFQTLILGNIITEQNLDIVKEECHIGEIEVRKRIPKYVR